MKKERKIGIIRKTKKFKLGSATKEVEYFFDLRYVTRMVVVVTLIWVALHYKQLWLVGLLAGVLLSRYFEK